MSVASITVSELLNEQAEELGLELLSDQADLQKKISFPNIKKPGLALAGYLKQIHPERIQILGKTELSYLKTLSPEECRARLKALCDLNISCILITASQPAPELLLECVNEQHIPLLRTQLSSSVIISRLTSYLEERLAPETALHGVLVDIFGIGVLILGKSGIGKSECALELILRGHRLVSDDIVNLKLRSNEVIIGTSPVLTRYLIEVRGLGILNVKELFGVTSVRYRKRVELVVNLESWKEQSYERLGLDSHKYRILDVELPLVNIPVGPGRNLAVIIEVAARNELLKLRGYDSAQQVSNALLERLKNGSSQKTEKTSLADIE